MAAKYEKLDLAAFTQKLADGDYASLTGARRAVGRMTTWSEADKKKARVLAEKHFGEGGAKKAPKKKAAKKKAKKKVAKKKAAPKKKAARKTAKKKASAKPAKKSVKKVRSKQKKSVTQVETSSTMDRLAETNLQIHAFGEAISHMAKNKDLGCPNADVQEGAKVAQQGLVAAVNNLCVLTKEVSVGAPGGNGAGNEAWNTAVDATNATLQGGDRVAPPPPPPPPSVEEATPEA